MTAEPSMWRDAMVEGNPGSNDVTTLSAVCSPTAKQP
jgi:hypothetical protein